MNLEILDRSSPQQPTNVPTVGNDYDSIKKEFEKNNFKILNPISYATIDISGELLVRNKKDFKDVYENLRYDTTKKGEVVEFSFIDKWLTDKTMRTYRLMDFLPQQKAPNDVYNTFKGFEAATKQLFDVDIENSLIMKHIKNLCNNEDDAFEYVIKTLALKVQKPYHLTNTALVFKSNDGAGKDLTFNWIGNKILGSEYYLNTQKPELVFGKFTSCIENKLLIILNDASGKDTFSINDTIKTAITAETNTIEHKGMKPYKNKNHIMYVFLSNNDNPVKVTQHERRFTGIECNNEICNNKEYFDALRNEMDSGNYDRAFFNYLLSIDINNYDFTNNRPNTKFYNDMKEMNTPPMALFLESIVMKENDSYKVQSSTLFKQYADFVESYNYKNQPTLTKFILDIKKIDGIEQTRTKTARFINLDLVKVKEYLIKNHNMDFTINDVEDDSVNPLDI